MDQHIQPFINTGEPCAESLENAFGVNVEPRKHQIMNFTHQTTDSELSVENFVESKIGEYFYCDTARSLSSIVDGLKDSQRKVLWVCLNRKNTEIKVAQLAGSVAEKTAYHHGEESMQDTIINMARTIVGVKPGNNLNLLEPIGQFGSRFNGGKDAAAAR